MELQIHCPCTHSYRIFGQHFLCYLVTCSVGNSTSFRYSRTPLIRINWDGEPSGYTENPDNL